MFKGVKRQFAIIGLVSDIGDLLFELKNGFDLCEETLFHVFDKIDLQLGFGFILSIKIEMRYPIV